jgi:branched-chain amino acid aminotransferase
MRGLRLSISETDNDLRQILTQLVVMTDFRDAYVQMTCTRGVPPQGSRDPRLCENRFSAFVQPFVWLANEEQRKKGLHLIVSKVQRIAPEAVDPRIKNFHWLDLTMGIFEAYDRGATAAVLPDRDGNLTEGAGFNIFLVKDGSLATPQRGVFEGMTRRTVIELCAEQGLPCRLTDVPADALNVADEVFITSTAGGIMPVTIVDGKPVRDGKPGPITRLLTERYWSLHDGNLHATPI